MPIPAENELEERIMGDPQWQAGAAWGEPRRAHPEGRVESHIADVLAHVEEQQLDTDARRKLRLVALLHDTFKRDVDDSRATVGENHHATIARRFAERYIDEPDVLDLVQLHDEAFNAWRSGRRSGNWTHAEQRARRLVERLGPSLPLYLAFYRADNASGDKDPEPLAWFERLASASGRSR
jgi:hypothetical protein